MSKKSRKEQMFIRRKFPKKMQKKLVMLFMAIILVFVCLVGRITYINAENGEKYTKTVLDQQQYSSRTIPFKRGDIVDRNGTKLATSERVYNVILDPKVLLSKEKYLEPTRQMLSDVFGIEASEVDRQLEEKPESQYVVLMKGVSYEKKQEYDAYISAKEEEAEANKTSTNIVGVWLEEDYVRTYPYGSLASDVIGFTASGNVGNSGLEAYYNSVLNGTDGREYGYLDQDSSVERTVKEAVDGDTIVTTIDLNVQQVVEKYILEFNEEHKGEYRKGEQGADNIAVIVMNPNNGEILAEASFPNYDLNNPRDLSAYYTEDEIAAMKNEDKVNALNQIWRNFCVSDTYEPGSTIKPFTIATALELGKVSNGDTFTCGGSLEVADRTIKCTHTHGTQSLGETLSNSCNVAMMQIGARIGKEDFVKYQHIFGFGEYTSIDLPGEGSTASLLFDPDTMGEVDLATSSFGQNFNVTMTQMAAGFCSLVNGGNYYKPHIVKQVQNSDGSVIENKDPVLMKKTISEETSEKLKEYMLETVEEGTGKAASVEGYDVGGKTGTAEKRGRNKQDYLVSFIGYAPQDTPEIMVYVVVDRPNVESQDNNKLAIGIAQKIMTEIFPYLNITKSE